MYYWPLPLCLKTMELYTLGNGLLLQLELNLNSGRELASLQPNETPEVIQQDLERCSLAMGVSPEALRKDSNTLRNISEKASLFLSAIWSVVPRTFSTQFKSSCWYADEKQAKQIECIVDGWKNIHWKTNRTILCKTDRTILCFPFFFIAGFPKSATSTLYHALVTHPSIAYLMTKEPQW